MELPLRLSWTKASMYTAGNISPCRDWKITCIVGTWPLEFMCPGTRYTCRLALMSSPAMYVTGWHYDTYIVTITGIFMAIIYLLIYTLLSLYISNSGSAKNSLDVSAPGLSPWIFSWTCFLWTPLCHVYIPYSDILQRSSRLCNWLSLRRLVPWIKHLPLYVGPLFGNLV